MTTNKQLAREFFQAWNDGGYEAGRPFLADTFTWWTPAQVSDQDTLPESMAVVYSHLDGPLVVTVHDVIAEDDRVAVEAESVANLKNGTVYNNLYHFKLRFEDGKIAEVKEYHDSKHVLDIWGPILGRTSE